MGGLAGIINPDQFQVHPLVANMLKIMRHRGKNTQDHLIVKQAEIGSVGSLIAHNEKKSLFCAVDGVISNLQDLQVKLRHHGFRLSPQSSPAEIIISAYDQWGPLFIEKVDGDFAISIWDNQKESLYLYRDRIGKKPLYWFNSQQQLIYASEIKALLTTGCVPQTPDPEGLASYLFFGYFPLDQTPIKDVNKLLPGNYLKRDKNGSVSVSPYWSLSSYFAAPRQRHYGDIVDQIQLLLFDSVSAQISDEQKQGCIISGGLGSASIAYFLERTAGAQNVLGFTTAFYHKNEEDLRAAITVAETLKIAENSLVISPNNYLENIIEINWSLDAPLADPTLPAAWKATEIAGQLSNNVFTGMGSDEFLAGHNRYTIEEQSPTVWKNFLRSAASFSYRALSPLKSIFGMRLIYGLLQQSLGNPWQLNYMSRQSVFSEKALQQASPRLARLFHPSVFLNKFHKIGAIPSILSSLMYLDIKTKLVDSYMFQYERFTANFGLEWHTPYLDRTLVEFLAGLPVPEHLQESQTAAFLKEILKPIFPESFIERPKKTRKDFLNTWIGQTELCTLFPLLLKGTLVDIGIISEIWLNNCTKDIQSMEENFSMLWSVLMLEIWFRLYINNPVSFAAPQISLKELLLET